MQHQAVLDGLGIAIASGRIAPGTVFNLEWVGAEYAASRSVVREAVRVLEALGLVASRRRVGITVLPPEQWNVFDPRLIRWRLEEGDRGALLVSFSQLRLGVEPVAARLAAVRATPEQCHTLALAVAEMDLTGRTGDTEAYLAADKLFHRTLLDACGNEMFAALTSVVEEALAGRTHHHLMPRSPNPQAIALHEDVARAVRDRDADRAEAAMRAIIEEAAEALQQQYAESTD